MNMAANEDGISRERADRRAVGFITAMFVEAGTDGFRAHHSLGRVVESMARRVNRLYLCAPLMPSGQGSGTRDYLLTAGNIELVPQPPYRSSAGALRCAAGVFSAYARTCAKADRIVVRGMVPLIGALYALCLRYRRRPCHWLIGDPVALLRSHRRGGRLRDVAALLAALSDGWMTRIGGRLARGSYLCNGRELADKYASARTRVVVSSTITRDEIHERFDACTGATLTVVFLGFVRPEKGVEDLFSAMPLVALHRQWRLLVVGDATGFEAYRDRLVTVAVEAGIAANIEWRGHVPYGPAMFEILRHADILVLPSLSEGTPRVLVEARANGVPVIATRVGGIPSSVTDEVNGLLVPPRDPPAIARAIERIADDAQLCRKLIDGGYEQAKRTTVDNLAEAILGSCQGHEVAV